MARKKKPKVDRSDYFVGDADSPGVVIHPPPPGWDDDEPESQVGGDKLDAFRKSKEEE